MSDEERDELKARVDELEAENGRVTKELSDVTDLYTTICDPPYSTSHDAQEARNERDRHRDRATQLEGERDRAFTLMAEMDKFINRAREAEAIAGELADETENSGNSDWLCGSCGAYGVGRGYEQHEGDCLVLRARAWMKQYGDPSQP